MPTWRGDFTGELFTHPSTVSRAGQVETKRLDTTGGITYVQSDRHANYVNIQAYRRALHRLAATMSWPWFEPRVLFPDAPAFRAVPTDEVSSSSPVKESRA